MPSPRQAGENVRICIVHQQDGTDVRIGKLCRSLSAGRDVTYLGWDRDGVESSPDLGGARRRLFVRRSGYGPGSIIVRVMFLFWIVRQILALRPGCVIAVNEEMAFPLAAFRRILRFRLVIDIHDPLADRVASQRMAPLLHFVQSVARNQAHSLIVTDENRLSRLAARHQAKAITIPNYPNRPTFDLNEIAAKSQLSEVVVAVVGSLHTTRGLNSLREAMRIFGECSVEAAGWIADTDAASFCRLPNVRYHGVLGMQASLQLMASCDVVFCFYDPSIANNRNASPNKIYEAICLGKRSIINSETVVADWVSSNNFGYTCPFADADGLADILRQIHGRLSAHRIPDPRFIAYANARLYWEVSEPRLLAAI